MLKDHKRLVAVGQRPRAAHEVVVAARSADDDGATLFLFPRISILQSSSDPGGGSVGVLVHEDGQRQLSEQAVVIGNKLANAVCASQFPNGLAVQEAIRQQHG